MKDCDNCDNCYLRDFKPSLHFHPSQKVSPISWENYLKSSYEIDDHCISYNGSVPRLNSSVVQNIPFYGKVMHAEYYVDLVYIFLYPINPGYNICCIKNNGYHTGDIEHIIIRVNKLTKSIIKVFFSSHSKEHLVKEKRNVHIKDKKLQVFVSLKSHACYPKAKTYYRVFGFANDKTSSQGIVWSPKKVVNIDKLKGKQFHFIGTTKENKPCVQGIHHKLYSFKNYQNVGAWGRFIIPLL
jgi:hypothetical protein